MSVYAWLLAQCLKHQNYTTTIVTNLFLEMPCIFYIRNCFRISYVTISDNGKVRVADLCE